MRKIFKIRSCKPAKLNNIKIYIQIFAHIGKVRTRQKQYNLLFSR